MRIIVQRVQHASCTVENQVVGSTRNGYLLLVGFTQGDTIQTVQYLANKVAKLRIFEDDQGKLNKSIIDMGYTILSISQFTLYGDASKGNRPSFTKAMRPDDAEALYRAFNDELTQVHHIHTESGRFGEHMEIDLLNDGPVTILLEK